MKLNLESIQTNVIGILLGGIIGTIISYTADYSGAGMATLIIVNLPIVFTLVTLVIYFLSRLIFKNKNWIISLLGIVLTIYTAISTHFADFTQQIN